MSNNEEDGPAGEKPPGPTITPREGSGAMFILTGEAGSIPIPIPVFILVEAEEDEERGGMEDSPKAGK